MERRSRTVMVVDDEPGVLAVAVRALERAGYRTLGAGTAAQAELLCREHPGTIDAVVMDVVLDDVHGFDAIPCLLKHRADLKVLYISGYPGQLTFAAKELSAPFLMKPFTADQLVEKVDGLLGIGDTRRVA